MALAVSLVVFEVFLGRRWRDHISFRHHFQVLVLVVLVQVVAIQGPIRLVERLAQLVFDRSEVLRLPDNAQMRLAHRRLHLHCLLLLLRCVSTISTGDTLLDKSFSVMIAASVSA